MNLISPNTSIAIKILSIMAVTAASALPQRASSEEITLLCEGEIGGEGIKTENQTFTVNLNQETGEIYGFPNKIVFGCIGNVIGRQDKTILTTDRQFAIKCDFPNLAKSVAVIDRYTKRMNVTTVYYGSPIRTEWGDYKCDFARNRAF